MQLSLVVPFYNRDVSSLVLLDTLTTLSLEGVEIIFVDDGSTDNTYSDLLSFQSAFSDLQLKLVQQSNKGPGGARNAGLKVAEGKYIWFVDSDDDITQEAIDFVRDSSTSDYDLINFNYLRNSIELSGVTVDPGSYTDAAEVRTILLGGFGPLWSNVYRREMLIANDIYYPEYCYHEDSPLVFIYPFFVKSMLNTDILAYKYNEDNESIVRSKPNLRTLDRLYTAEYGFKKGLKHSPNKAEIAILKRTFVHLYLVSSVGIYSTKKPSKQWLVMWRIMKNYRRLLKDLNISYSVFDAFSSKESSSVFDDSSSKESSIKYKLFLCSHWMFSYALPGDTAKHFDNVRRKAWE